MSIDTEPRAAPTRPVNQPRRTRRRWPLRALAVVLLVTGLLWVGLRIPPRPLPVPAGCSAGSGFVALPDGLPAPVERFYRTLYGAEVPTVNTAVITGRGTMRINGVTLPARFRFSHVTGEAYRHYIETTLFGVRVLKVDEWFVDGAGRLELPFAVVEGAHTDQGANLALWAEAVWMPAVWGTHPRAAWEPIDATSARLRVPFGAGIETFVVDFDPDTGLLTRMESLRFKSEEATTKTRWINEVVEWGQVDGYPTPIVTTVGWGDETSPWARLRTEALIYNADLTTYLHAHGP
jgi:hypothetical protein